MKRHMQQKPQAVQAAPKEGRSLWRRLRQRARVVWRWIIVRTVRGITTRFQTERPVDPVQVGDVRQFPQNSRW